MFPHPTPKDPAAPRAFGTTFALLRPLPRQSRALARCVLPLLVAALLAPAPIRADTVLVPKLTAWRWFAASAPPAGAWTGTGYDDAAWLAGPGVLGFGDPFVVTPVPFGPNPNAKYTTTYFRHAFTLAALPAGPGLRLQANFDDGFALYLNGVEVARRGLPAGAPTHGTFAASHEAGVYETIDLAPFLGLLVTGTNVLAAEVHQATAASSDLAWDAELAAVAGVTVTRGPYLQRATDDAVVVRWRTDTPTASEVRVGAFPEVLDRAFADAAVTTEHEVAVTGLDPGADVYYSVGIPGTPLVGADAAHVFRALPAPGTRGAVRVWVIGDAGRGSAIQFSVRDAFEARAPAWRPDLWMMLGDNAYDSGTDTEYQSKFFGVYPNRLARTPLYPVRGNHDVLYAGAPNDYLEFFTLPAAGEAGGVPSGSESYYSFDVANLHVVVLDSEGSDRSLAGPMVDWLRRDLAATTADWSVACWHHPPYTKGSHDSDNELDSGARMGEMRRNIVPILDSLGVDLTMTGHSHSYERSFLVRGHYGPSTTWSPAMMLDGGDGSPGGDGPYIKPTAGRAPLEGIVHVVAGSSGLNSGGPLNHPAMRTSLDLPGSVLLEVAGGRLDLRFLGAGGVVRDSFTILKGGPVAVPATVAPDLALALDGSNPGRGAHALRFALPQAGHARLEILDPRGRRVATLVDAVLAAGAHAARWIPTPGTPSGVYFARLGEAGRGRTLRLVHLR